WGRKRRDHGGAGFTSVRSQVQVLSRPLKTKYLFQTPLPVKDLVLTGKKIILFCDKSAYLYDLLQQKEFIKHGHL
ncbi:MAG: hypothetical protein KJ063_02610, partial [Anaerolineae bacterium]|nr:hypothetical protein [Anaerolineae bacterium]